MKFRLFRFCLLSLYCILPAFAFADGMPDADGTCAAQTTALQQSMQTANYCEKTEDCTAAYFGCPFGCETLVNRNEVAKLTPRVQTFNAQCPACKYRCRAIDPKSLVTCQNKRCVRTSNE